MTAINTLLMPDAAHVFADRGHYSPSFEVARIAPKIMPLPEWNAVVLFCGVTDLGALLHGALARVTPPREKTRAFAEATQSVVAPFVLQRPFTAYLFGFDRRPFGIAVEEGMLVHELPVYSVTKSIGVPESFDATDIVGSGLAIMEAQRRASPVVVGACDYARVDAAGIHRSTLRVW